MSGGWRLPGDWQLVAPASWRPAPRHEFAVQMQWLKAKEGEQTLLTEGYKGSWTRGEHQLCGGRGQ